MSSSGPNSPGTLNNLWNGSRDLSDEANAASSNDAYAWSGQVSGSFDVSTLEAINFGFAIPVGSTINGIVVEVEKKALTNDTKYVIDYTVKIRKADGSYGSTNKADVVTKWGTSDAYVSYGSSNDLWGESWTPADINDADFGVGVQMYLVGQVAGYIDHIRITVYYTEAATGYSHKVSGVAPASISKVIGVATASIQSVATVDT